jgi:hypothetical protein
LKENVIMKYALPFGVVVSFVAPLLLIAQQTDAVPENKLLRRLVGQWEYVSEITVEPGQPPVKSTGSETVRAIGTTWIVAENRGTAFGMPFTGIMTLGYDPQTQKYAGTWIDSMQSHMFQYEITADESSNVLTLVADGPSPIDPGKTSKYKDVIEVKGDDQKVLKSSVQMEDGSWTEFMTVTYSRKKS